MVTMRSIAIAAIAATLSVSVPVTAANAASRAGSAVPTASAAGVAVAPYARSNRGSAFAAWPAYLIIALTAAAAIWMVTHDSDGELSISRG